MPATPEEKRQLRRFGLIVLNCLAPGLGNTVFVSKQRFAIICFWIVFQVALANPFIYFAFLIGSIAYGLIELNQKGETVDTDAHIPSDLQKGNPALRASLRDNDQADQSDYATDNFASKQLLAEQQLQKQRAAEEALEREHASQANADTDPTAGASWLQERLRETLGPDTDPTPAAQDVWQQMQTDPAAPLSRPSSLAQMQADPWTQQQTDPGSLSLSNHHPLLQQKTDAAAPLATPATRSEQSQDPWLQQMTDPGLGFLSPVPQAIPEYRIDASESSLPEPGPTEGNCEDTVMKCHSCGYKRDHDFAFCPKCATMF